MHWYVLIGLVAALFLIQFGALSVWVVVLALALKTVVIAIVVVAVIAGGVWLWRRYVRRSPAYRTVDPPKQIAP